MFKSSRSPLAAAKLVPVLLIAGVVAAGSYAFTASNSVSSAPAGMGESSAFSGYNATNVKWTLDPSNPAGIDYVNFSLSPVTSSTTVYAGADNGTTISWTSACTIVGSISGGSAQYTCNFATDPSVSATTKLAVSAAN